MRTYTLEQLWHTLIMQEGYHVRTEKSMVIRPDAARRVYAAIGSEYEIKSIEKEYITEEDFMNMYDLKNNIVLEEVHERLKELLRRCDPDSYDFEKDFQSDFCKILNQNYYELSEVRTKPLFNQATKRKYWSLDIVLKAKDMYIPIELKFRKEEQTQADYADDFKEDVQRINSLLAQYDDMPMGYAIILTNIDRLLEECKSKVPELNCEQHENNSVESIEQNSYWIGIVSRKQAEGRKTTNDSFAPNWTKKEEIVKE